MLRGPRRGYAGPAAPPAIEGYESESSAVGTLRAINRGFNAISGGGSNVSISDASGADDLEPRRAEKTSKTLATGFGGPAAQPAVQTNSRGSMTVT